MADDRMEKDGRERNIDGSGSPRSQPMPQAGAPERGNATSLRGARRSSPRPAGRRRRASS